jgi:hypothetical protein
MRFIGILAFVMAMATPLAVAAPAPMPPEEPGYEQ